MQAIFRMGIPVSGKNLFPSNIQGLPTWYEIRVNATGYTARALDYDLMVAMNSQTYAEDIAEVRHGGYVLYDSSWPLDPDLVRDDVTFLGVPLAAMCIENFATPRERILMKNIAYAGAIVALLGIDVDARRRRCSTRPSRATRRCATRTSARCASATTTRVENFDCPLAVPRRADGRDRRHDPDRRQHRRPRWAASTPAPPSPRWYPITPATSVMDNFTQLCAQYRRETDRERRSDAPATYANNYLIIQAEDEIAAIGMVLGASWSGARAFTSTSGRASR